jgi:hypothetical protein
MQLISTVSHTDDTRTKYMSCFMCGHNVDMLGMVAYVVVPERKIQICSIQLLARLIDW